MVVGDQRRRKERQVIAALADVLPEEEWKDYDWLGPEAWHGGTTLVEGGVLVPPGQSWEGLGSAVAERLEACDGPGVLAARRVLPGTGTIWVWYRQGPYN